MTTSVPPIEDFLAYDTTERRFKESFAVLYKRLVEEGATVEQLAALIASFDQSVTSAEAADDFNSI